ncbi:hypothetical protein [Streptomyces tauricus]|uniref:hypothetical protein n=1 Tax=Streptomyces tauricus TaxID=68274 RepID=UPI00224412C8|nr:hypothetical protein [Streptomyces tauricus]MCW8103004.1 hypothetical protein [Streptomyces tauricus]
MSFSGGEITWRVARVGSSSVMPLWLDVNRHPERDEAYVTGAERAGSYGLTRETHHPLQAFGLIDVVPDADRHDDYHPDGRPPPCHRVTVVADGLHQDAAPRINDVLRRHRPLVPPAEHVTPPGRNPVHRSEFWDRPEAGEARDLARRRFVNAVRNPQPIPTAGWILLANGSPSSTGFSALAHRLLAVSRPDVVAGGSVRGAA